MESFDVEIDFPKFPSTAICIFIRRRRSRPLQPSTCWLWCQMSISRSGSLHLYFYNYDVGSTTSHETKSFVQEISKYVDIKSFFCFETISPHHHHQLPIIITGNSHSNVRVKITWIHFWVLIGHSLNAEAWLVRLPPPINLPFTSVSRSPASSTSLFSFLSRKTFSSVIDIS